MTTEQKTPPPHRGPRWTRDLPPLFGATILIVVLALVMPSALRVPQQDPTPVLEYAPVPPTDDNAPNPQGNLSSLALGSSDTLEEGSVAPPLAKARGKDPKDKDCKGKPARQTEDPMSPPCVPFFDGDNGGTTWRGVTKDEVVVVAYFDIGVYSDEPAYDEGIYDVDTIPANPCPKQADAQATQCSHVLIRATRALQNYFNDRFQTYNRRVKFYAMFTNASTPRDRRADAAKILDEIEPFSVLDLAIFNGYNEEFVNAIAAPGREMLVFSSGITAHTNAFYRNNAPLAWGFWPDVEHWAKMFSTYVCANVEPFRVSHSGGPAGVGNMNGRERRYGFFHTTDPGQQGLLRFYDLVSAQLRAQCGITPAATGTFPRSTFIVDGRDDGSKQRDAVVKFMDEDVTTVLYLGGVEGQFSKQAKALGYFPEIVVAGDLFNDNPGNARLQDQDVWKNAWAMSYQIREDRLAARQGYAAAQEGDPSIDDDGAVYGANFYRDFFMLFQGIQVAGPKLNPANIDQGFHAIPPKPSGSPHVAACFFDPSDYTCVKDAMEMWWDTTGQRTGSSTLGCWRMVDAGNRYLAGTWAGRDSVFQDRADLCQNGNGSYRLYTGTS